MRSIIKAHYDILYNDEPVMTVREEKGWVKVLDALLGEVPILGMFTGYFLHPAYLVTRNPEGSFGGSGSSGVEQGELVMRLEKQPAFFEGKFILENKLPLDPQEESLVLLSLMMVLLLERGRG
jgi:hypothetical protein